MDEQNEISDSLSASATMLRSQARDMADEMADVLNRLKYDSPISSRCHKLYASLRDTLEAIDDLFPDA